MGEKDKDSSPASTANPSSDAAWSNGTATRFEKYVHDDDDLDTFFIHKQQRS
jgi:hypothetical protein